VDRYLKNGNIKRINRKPISYKITKLQVKYALKLLKQNEQITMFELAKLIKKNIKISISHQDNLAMLLEITTEQEKELDMNIFPKMKYGKPTDKQKESNNFYKEVDKFSLNKLIGLDETSIKPSMIMEYSRCSLGKRCVVKTDDSFS